MEGLMSTIIGTMLSYSVCTYLLNILNNNMCSVFNEIRKDLDKLSNKTRYILNFLGFFLVISISVLLNYILNINYFGQGLIIGFLLSVKDICFK